MRIEEIGNQFNIVLVDDEREEREGIAYLIEKYGYPLHVVYASNGKEALHYIYHNQADILFTDVKMPVMDGLELAKLVNEYNPDIKIVIFSAYGEFDYAKQALEANAVSYLLKPIELDEFKTLMDNLMHTIAVEKEEKKSREEKNRYYYNNILYKVFAMAKINAYEAEDLAAHLFGKGILSLLIHIEFMDSFFDIHEEEFIRCAETYLGREFHYIELYPNEACILMSSRKLPQKKELTEQLGKVFRDIRNDSSEDNQSLVIVSRTVSTVEELLTQQERITHIQDEVFGYHDKIIFVEDYYTNAEHYVKDIEVIGAELREAVDTLDAELIGKENRKLVKAIEESGQTSRIYIQNMLYSMIKALCDKVRPENLDELLIRAERLFQIKDPIGMLKEYREAVDILLNLIGVREDRSGIISEIRNIVELEYRRDIGLDFVADRVNLSPAYVSYLFKKETGQTLVKYITDKKMDRAKKMLSDRNLKVMQVAKSCGYENQSYFNKLFKNYFGVTPKQYRDSL